MKQLSCSKAFLKANYLCGIKIVPFLLTFLTITSFSQTSNIWTQKADFGGMARSFSTSFSIGDKGYITLGYNGNNFKDLWEFDSNTNSWTQKADFGGTARRVAVAFAIGSKGYVGTGYDGSPEKDFWEFDQSTNTWSRKADFGGSARYAAVGFAIGNKGYIGTGNNGNNDPVAREKDFWEWDQATDVWTRKADFGGMPEDYAIGFSIDTMGYIGIGQPYLINHTRDFWEWNQASDTWIQKSNFGGVIRNSAVSFAIGTKGFVGFGQAEDGSTNLTDLWEWNQSSNLWLQEAFFSGTPRSYPTSGFSIGNKGYLGAGFDGNNYLNDFWEYTPEITPAIKSNTAATTNEQENATENPLIIYPNPNTGLFTMEVCKKDITDKVKIEVLNSVGQMVYSKVPQITDGCIKANVELAKDLHDGIYFLHLKTGQEDHVTKMILTR